MTFLILNFLTKNLFLNNFNILIFLCCNFILFNSIFIFFVKNPVYSLILLIFNYTLISVIFFIYGFQFLAFIYALIYICAVSILLIFSLMLLNFKLIFYKTLKKKNLLIIIGLIFLFEIFLFLLNYFIDINIIYYYNVEKNINWFNYLFKKDELVYLGLEIFIFNKDIIFLLGIFLFMILIAAVSIVFTVKSSKKQQLFLQLKKHTPRLFNV